MPLMVLSKFCVLHKASGRELQEQNECIYDQGGCVLLLLLLAFVWCMCLSMCAFVWVVCL